MVGVGVGVDYGADHRSRGIMLLTGREYVLPHSVTETRTDTITILLSLAASHIRTHFNSLKCFPSAFLSLSLPAVLLY